MHFLRSFSCEDRVYLPFIWETRKFWLEKIKGTRHSVRKASKIMDRDLRRLVPHSYLSLSLIWIFFVVGPSLTRLGCAGAVCPSRNLWKRAMFDRGEAEASSSEFGTPKCERQASFRSYWCCPNSLLAASLLAHAYRAFVQIFEKKEKLLAVFTRSNYIIKCFLH